MDRPTITRDDLRHRIRRRDRIVGIWSGIGLALLLLLMGVVTIPTEWFFSDEQRVDRLIASWGTGAVIGGFALFLIGIGVIAYRVIIPMFRFPDSPDLMCPACRAPWRQLGLLIASGRCPSCDAIVLEPVTPVLDADTLPTWEQFEKQWRRSNRLAEMTMFSTSGSFLGVLGIGGLIIRIGNIEPGTVVAQAVGIGLIALAAGVVGIILWRAGLEWRVLSLIRCPVCRSWLADRILRSTGNCHECGQPAVRVNESDRAEPRTK